MALRRQARKARAAKPEKQDGPVERRRDWRDWVETASRLAPLVLRIWDVIDKLDDDQ